MRHITVAAHLSASVLGLGLICCSAVAAETDTAATQLEASEQIDEIIVTAQKREQSLTDVGMSIAAIRGDELARRQVVDTADLARVVPGLTYATSGINTPVYSIRGVGFNESSLAASPTVSVYVDQVPLPYPAMSQGAALDLERVEVLKGPQGTLFGQNATAGAINFIAAKPTSEFDAQISGTYGRFDRYELAGHVSGPLADTLSARVAVSHRGGGDWQKSQSRPGDHLGDMDKTAWRALLDWNATENLKLTLSVNGWIDKSDTQAPQLQNIYVNPNPTPHLCSSANPAFCFVAGFPPTPRNPRAAEWDPGRSLYRDDRFVQPSLRADWQVNDAVAITSITAYNSYKTEAHFDQDGVPITDIFYNTDGEIKAFNQELRATTQLDRFTAILGGSYSDDEIDDAQLVNADFSSNGQSILGVHVPATANSSHQEVTSWGIFAHGEYELRDNLDAIAGVRYNKDERDFSGCLADTGDGSAAAAFTRLSNAFSGRPLTTPNPLFVPGGCMTLTRPNFDPALVSNELNEDNVSWNAGLNYHPVDDSLLYVRVSRGYKSGNFPTLAYSFVDQVAPVVQERLQAYEAGAKSTLWNRTVQLEAAGFYYDYKDKQMKGKGFYPPLGPLGALQNIPKSHVYGAELSAVVRPLAGLTLNASGSWIKTKVTEFVGRDPDGVLQDLEGIPFNFSPKWQAQAGAQYVWALSSSLRGRAGADLVYRSKTTSALGGNSTYDIDSYTLLDLNLGIDSADGRWSALLWGKNVTNEYYWTNTLLIIDTVVRWAGQPATYGATLTYHFD